jgi:hypothetical protein
VEHLAQEYGIDPAHIYVEPVDDNNSSGIEASGGDCAAGEPTHKDRQDAPLHGAIQVTVPVEHSSLAVVKNSLQEGGAVNIEEF